MKGVKVIVAFVLGVGYSSAWWALAAFGSSQEVPLAALPILSTIALAVFCIAWLVVHWEE